MPFLPYEHLTVEHNYTGSSWQDFTGDLVTVQINLREFPGQHTATLTFVNEDMDPAQSDGTTVMKRGDKVRVFMENASGNSRKTATFLVKKVTTAIDLSKPVGRQYVVTANLRGAGITGVGGAA
jgi:hypothetical protein